MHSLESNKQQQIVHLFKSFQLVRFPIVRRLKFVAVLGGLSHYQQSTTILSKNEKNFNLFTRYGILFRLLSES